MNEPHYSTAHPTLAVLTRPKWRRSIGLAVLAICLAGGGWYVYLDWALDRELQDALASADRLDPGWRMQELEARRERVPDGENSTELFMITQQWLPLPRASVRLKEDLQKVSPAVPFSEEQTQALRGELRQAEPLLAKLREAANKPHGRYHTPWTPYLVFTPLPHADALRAVEHWLRFDILLRLQEKDVAGALISCRALLNAARSVGDEPVPTMQLYRCFLMRQGVLALERLLAQGQVPAETLVALQALLEQEDAHPAVLLWLRAERAMLDGMLEAVPTSDLYAARARRLGNAPVVTELDYVLVDKSLALLVSGPLRENRARLLAYTTELVEIAKLPGDQAVAQLREQAAELTKDTTVRRAVAENLEAIVKIYRRSRAELRSVAAALAAERYRLCHGRWPESLAEVVPTYLAQIPLDPYDGQPVRFHRVADGLLIYSLGSDGEDNGGNLGRAEALPGTEVGFRLWDVPQRAGRGRVEGAKHTSSR